MEAERVIYSYLRSRGLKNTETALRSEIKNLFKFDLTPSIYLENCEDSFTSIIQGLSDPSTTDTFYSSFERYLIWASSSLEIYKQELLKFSSPIFIYMYLKLIEKGCLNIACSFFSAFSQILSTADHSLLSTIKTPNDLNSDSIKKTYFLKIDNVQVKYMITIKKSSLLLFMGFIEEFKLSCILSIINQFIEIVICQEPNNDLPLMIYDIETFKNKSSLSLTVIQEEDKRREVKVPLPYISNSYLSDKSGELENKIDLTCHLPYIACYSISSPDDSCTALDISEDGQILVSGFEDSVIRVFFLQDPKNFTQLVGHSSPILSLSVSPDKFYLISSSDDSEIRLWSLLSYTCLTSYPFHSNPVWQVKFSPTGHYFASGCAAGSLALWSVEYNHPLKLLIGHVSDIFSVQFHPRGTYLASGSKDRTVRVWDTSTGECVRVICIHNSGISGVCFSRNGKNLYSSDEDGNVFAVDVGEKEIIWKKNLGCSVVSIGVSQENCIIACALENRAVSLIDSNGEMIKMCKSKNVRYFSVVFTIRNLLCVTGVR